MVVCFFFGPVGLSLFRLCKNFPSPIVVSFLEMLNQTSINMEREKRRIFHAH